MEIFWENSNLHKGKCSTNSNTNQTLSILFQNFQTQFSQNVLWNSPECDLFSTKKKGKIVRNMRNFHFFNIIFVFLQNADMENVKKNEETKGWYLPGISRNFGNLKEL
jgi:hypothetical protein